MKKIWLFGVLVSVMSMVVAALWQAFLESGDYFFFTFDSKTDLGAIIFTSWREIAWVVNILLIGIIVLIISRMEKGKTDNRLTRIAVIITAALTVTIVVMAKMLWNMNGMSIGWDSFADVFDWTFYFFSSAWIDQSVLTEIPLFILAAALFFRNGSKKEKAVKEEKEKLSVAVVS